MGKFASLACVAQLRRPRTSESEIVSSNPGEYVKKKKKKNLLLNYIEYVWGGGGEGIEGCEGGHIEICWG